MLGMAGRRSAPSTTMALTNASLASLEDALSRSRPEAVLRAVSDAFGRRAAILCGMQRAGTVLCHMAASLGLELDVLFVDTGVLHRETIATRDKLAAAHPTLRVRTLWPAATFEEQVDRVGVLYLTKEGQERCCELRKTDPLRRVRGQYDVLFGALRRDEGGKRAGVRFVELDRELAVLRVHPLAGTTRADLDAYVAAKAGTEMPVVINPLHRWGFATIGCVPCTTPVRPDEEERAGRWRHLTDVAYCGINPTDREAFDSPMTDAEEGRIERGLERFAECLAAEEAAP